MEKSNFIIRPGGRNDVPELHALVVELARYERAEKEVLLTKEQMAEDGFGDQPKYRVFVAEADEEVVGMALYYMRYSTWKGETLHLEDLVVREGYRKDGIGSALFRAVVAEACDLGVGRMEWEVLGWNEPARQFYKKYNGSGDSEWELWKLTPEQMKEINAGT